MTCDDVFDMLTRGPFPSGAASDELVEDHLSSCDDCRRLAAALQPAVNLLREVVECDEAAGLPEYTGRTIRPVADSLAARDADVLPHDIIKAGLSDAARRTGPRGIAGRHPPSPHAGRPRRPGFQQAAARAARFADPHTNLFRFAAAVLLGVVVSAGARELVLSRATSTDAISSVAAVPAVDSQAEQSRVIAPTRVSLASLALPPACTPPSKPPVETDGASQAGPIQLASADVSLRQECCTECHSWAKGGLTSTEGRAVLVRACAACHQ